MSSMRILYIHWEYRWYILHNDRVRWQCPVFPEFQWNGSKPTAIELNRVDKTILTVCTANPFSSICEWSWLLCPLRFPIHRHLMQLFSFIIYYLRLIPILLLLSTKYDELTWFASYLASYRISTLISDLILWHEMSRRYICFVSMNSSGVPQGNRSRQRVLND
jgi:hypothetical protein